MIRLMQLAVAASSMVPHRAAVGPRVAAALRLCAAATDRVAPVNITWREESNFVETVVPSVSLTRSRDGSTGTATFRFERPGVLALNDVWNNGLITGLWLHDEEGLSLIHI